MPYPKKPGADWVQIEQEYRHKVVPGLMSLNALAKQHPVSRQAISQVAKREGWPELPGKLQPLAKVATDVVASDTGKQAKLGSKDTPGARSEILEALRNGATRKVAALAGGISPDTLTRWCDKDQDFAADVAIAEGQMVAQQLKNIKDAGDRGDWRASDRLVSTHHLTREEFGRQAGGGNVSINFSFSRDTMMDEPKIIEG